jgi:hypothetical protein
MLTLTPSLCSLLDQEFHPRQTLFQRMNLLLLRLIQQHGIEHLILYRFNLAIRILGVEILVITRPEVCFTMRLKPNCPVPVEFQYAQFVPSASRSALRSSIGSMKPARVGVEDTLWDTANRGQARFDLMSIRFGYFKRIRAMQPYARAGNIVCQERDRIETATRWPPLTYRIQSSPTLRRVDASLLLGLVFPRTHLCQQASACRTGMS